MQIISFPAHYQSVYTNFDISSFSLISCVVKRLIAQGYISIFISYIHCFVIRSADRRSLFQLQNCRIVAAKIQIFNRRAAFLISHRTASCGRGLRPTRPRAGFLFE